MSHGYPDIQNLSTANLFELVLKYHTIKWWKNAMLERLDDDAKALAWQKELVESLRRGMESCDREIELLRGQLSALKEQTRWIPVSERLPTKADADEFGRVLIYRITTESQQATAKGLYDWQMVRYCNPNETWWMPLPPNPITPPEGA